MIKRTLYFGNSCLLRKKNNQLVAEFAADTGNPELSVPIEDIGLLMLDNCQITISTALLMALNENNTAVINCNDSHLPYGLMLPMFSHNIFPEKLRNQLEASVPLMKNLWMQTVVAKISNQSALLKRKGANTEKMEYYIRQVKSGDPQNIEGRAAAYYWKQLWAERFFVRHRFGEPPNNLLNYGYAILRAVIARSLVTSGLFPSIGIHHRNKYNPYCLADDIMEPYRPYVDSLVMDIVSDTTEIEDLTPSVKRRLLETPAIDIMIDGKTSPLMVGAQRTTASLAACFDGTARKILFPEF